MKGLDKEVRMLFGELTEFNGIRWKMVGYRVLFKR